jgi:FeS assembly SUF system protein
LSQPSNDAPRIIPLADAPPAPELPSEGTQVTSLDAAQGKAAASTFERDPLNSLKFQPPIVEAISKVFDPEIPINIYELGLIYDMDVDSASNVYIRMTLTAPGCPSAQQIPLDVERRVREVAGLNDVKVEVVWDPPWTKERMSDAAKLTLGIF